MSEQPKKREWVKNAMIIFLLILLILTFFSNTIMNRTLPRVATQYIQSGTITAKVRGTGKVESVGLYEVKAETTREIRAVMVKAGQEVNEGDVLFIMGDGTSEEIKQATEKLRQLQVSYQKTAISGPSYDYTLEQYQIEMAEMMLADAQAAEQEALRVLQESTSSGIGVSEADILQAKAEYEAKAAAAAACELDYNNRVNAAMTYYDEKATAYNAAMEALIAYVGDEDSEEYRILAEKVETAKILMDDAEIKLDNLTNNPDPAWEAAKAEAQAAFDKVQKMMEIANGYLNGPAAEAYSAAVKARQAAEETVIAKRAALNQSQMSNGKAAATLAIDLKDLSEQIETAKQELAILTGGEENQITAKVSGKIQSVSFTAGNTAAKDSVLCTIEVPDMGYSLSFSCTNDQARRLHVGDTATVSNYYWGSQIEATLASIQTDPKNPQSSKILTFDLKGDVTSGSELTIAVGSKSATYDVIVPNNAIRTDANGTYVLVIEARNSAMMNRYFAKRVSVQAIVSDDLNSAVTGELNAGDYVITTSNVPIKSGDQVRFDENG